MQDVMTATDMAWLADNWWLVAAAVLLLAAVLWRLLRRKPGVGDRVREDEPNDAPRAPLEPRRPDIEPARRMDFKDATRFDGVRETVSGPMRPDAAPVVLPPVEQPPVEQPAVDRLAVPAKTDDATIAMESAPDADDLTRIKGLGPKLKAALAALGVTRFAEIAAWNDSDIARIDAALPSVFQGRILRDQWVEQAALLANGDEAGFAAKFGAL